MLTIHEVELPQTLQLELKEQAAFTDSFARFTHGYLSGFGQPVTMAAALIGPILVAFAYLSSDFYTTLEVTTIFFLTSLVFMMIAWYINRAQIREAYTRSTIQRKQAQAALRSGRGEQWSLQLKEHPVFYDYEGGVICLAKSSDTKTLFFDIPAAREDARWYLYMNGDLYRKKWDWLKLHGSGALTEFFANGDRLMGKGHIFYLDTSEAWDAIHLVLGAPQDGDLIDMPFEEAKKTIERLL